ncbi:unnamed protein product [Bursaphelenchus xylophilus]|uniref:(pine wood nematode) hypothetical protein n=1 Tax=Bursaphelenchus xylophilus TaxID=6326 RepID=A0A1I7RQH1_BURXY|nr:unnamed protein product [Bursaphelenchus xylophilus]CAG9104571.1 unnamed protein product [Bursaphelenchus xylophilus]
MWTKLFVFLCLITVASARTKWEVRAEGRVLCDGSPANATVSLKEIDPLQDDLLQQTTTDDHGRYFLHGEETEYTQIRPYLVVEHHCDGKYERVRHDIPSYFVYAQEHEGHPIFVKHFSFNRTTQPTTRLP